MPCNQPVTQIYTHILERGANAVKSPFSLVVGVQPVGRAQAPISRNPVNGADKNRVQETVVDYRLTG